MTSRSFVLALAALAAVVLLPCAGLIAMAGFDGLYGQDSFAYTDYARGPLTTALGRLELPPPFYWPPGYPILIATLGAVAGDRAGQVVSLVAGALIPVLTALLALEVVGGVMTPRRQIVIALLAGLVAAVAGQLWQSSVVGMADTSAAAVATLGAWATCRFLRGGRVRWLALGAGALTFAVEIRWIYGLAALPLAAAALHELWRWRRGRPSEAVRGTVVALVVVALTALPTAVPMIGAIVRGETPPFTADFAAYHWTADNALRRTFDTLDGRLEYDQPTGLFYLSQPLRRYWFWLPALLALPGLLMTLRRLTVSSAAVLVMWPALVVGFMAGGGYQNTRFFLTTVPPIAILVALGGDWVWRSAARLDGRGSGPDRTRHASAGVRAALALGLGAALVLNAVFGAGLTRSFMDRQVADLTAIRSLAAQATGDARLISLGATPALRHDGREVVELYWLDGESALDLVADGRPTYLLVDMASIRGQWAGRDPALAVTALESGPGLEPVASAALWSLYRVGSGTTLGPR